MIAVRAAASVDQLVVTGDQLETLAVRVGEQCAGEVEQLVIAGGDAVEVAVGAHERQQLCQIVLGNHRDVHGSQS
jgi:hypothetical protein